MSRRWTRAELEGAHLVWLLRLTYAGRIWYIATEASEPVDANGEAIPHYGSMGEIDVEIAMSGTGQEPVKLDADISLSWPESSPIAALIAQGHDLCSARAELSLWSADQSYESRRVYIDGFVDNAAYGDALEPVEFTVAGYPWAGGVLVPATTATVNSTDWPLAPSDSIGEVYPEVLGLPGQYERVPSATTSGSPAIRVEMDTLSPDDAEKLLIAGHHVQATSVFIFDSSFNSGSFSVVNETDASGREIATVDISSPGSLDVTDTEFWAGWTEANGGGRLNNDGTLLHRAGDVAIYFLKASGREIDLAAWDNVLPELNARLRIAGYWQESIDPWEWLQDHVIAELPMELLDGPNGIRPVMYRYNATKSDAIETITTYRSDGAADATVTEGPVYSRRTEIVNQASLS